MNSTVLKEIIAFLFGRKYYANIIITRGTRQGKRHLPVFTDEVQCVSCWKCSFLDRLKILFTGRVWASVRSGSTQPPMWIAADYPFVDNPERSQE